MAGGLGDFAVQFIRDLVITVLLAGSPVLVRYWLSQRGKLSFLGVPNVLARLRAEGPRALTSSPAVRIFVSNIRVKHLAGGATLACVSIDRGFSGPAITEGEYGFAVDFARRIGARALPRGAAQSLPTRLPFNHIVCPIEASPAYPGAMPLPMANAVVREVVRVDFDGNPQLTEQVESRFEEGGCVLVVGSSIYNAVTAYALQMFGSEFAFIKERRSDPSSGETYYVRGIRVKDWHGSTEPVLDHLRTDERIVPPGSAPFTEYFIVEKFTRPAGLPVTVFLCAGLGTAATSAAIATLARWTALRRTFGDRDFAALYSLVIAGADHTDDAPSLRNVQRRWAYDKGRAETITS